MDQRAMNIRIPESRVRFPSKFQNIFLLFSPFSSNRDESSKENLRRTQLTMGQRSVTSHGYPVGGVKQPLCSRGRRAWRAKVARSVWWGVMFDGGGKGEHEADTRLHSMTLMHTPSDRVRVAPVKS